MSDLRARITDPSQSHKAMAKMRKRDATRPLLAQFRLGPQTISEAAYALVQPIDSEPLARAYHSLRRIGASLAAQELICSFGDEVYGITTAGVNLLES